MAAPLPSYVARVCWNETGWVRPDGTAAGAEHGTYAARMGFGHEEWLFDFAWKLDGWKYGFLQPVNKSRARLERTPIDVRLYTISPDADRFYIGHLKACEVLDEATAAAARHEFKKRGWFQSMVRQVKHVGGDDAGLKYDDAAGLFNIRYRQSDAILFDPMVPAGARDGIQKLQRYVLVRLDGALKALENQWARRVGTVELRPTGKQLRGAIPRREVDLVHNDLQNALFELLVSKFGEAAVRMEERFADIWLRRSAAPCDLIGVGAKRIRETERA